MTRYTEADLACDAGRLADWSAELKTAVTLGGHAPHVAELAKAISTVANRILEREGRPTGVEPTPRNDGYERTS